MCTCHYNIYIFDIIKIIIHTTWITNCIHDIYTHMIFARVVDNLIQWVYINDSAEIIIFLGIMCKVHYLRFNMLVGYSRVIKTWLKRRGQNNITYCAFLKLHASKIIKYTCLYYYLIVFKLKKCISLYFLYLFTTLLPPH